MYLFVADIFYRLYINLSIITRGCKKNESKIAFLHGPKGLRIEKVELPALKPNQVLIKVGACGICGSDVECYEGKSDEGRHDIASYTLGHEWAGKIVEVGSDVKDFKSGIKVTGDCVLDVGNVQTVRL